MLFSRSKESLILIKMIIVSKHLIKETTFIIDNFWLYEEYCFLNLPPIFLCPFSDFGKRYKNKLNSIFGKCTGQN
jgi:hypothetical protein